MDHWGSEMYVTPGVVVDGELVTTNLVDINLGIRILLGSSYYEDWAERGDVRPARPAREPGRQAAPVEPDDAPEAAEARPRGRQLQLGDEPALVRQAHRRPPRARHRRRRARAAVGDGARGHGRHAVREGDRLERADRPAALGAAPGDDASSGRCRSGRTRSSATARASTSSRYAAGMALHFVEKALARGPRGPDEDVRGLRGARRGDRLRLPRGGARRALAPPRDPRQEDRELPPVPADAVERQPDATATARPARTRTRCRGCRSSRRTTSDELPRDRHHARRSGASTRACRAACTCTSARARR